MRIWLALVLFLVFVKEVIKANIDVAVWIFKSNEKLRPGFLKMPLDLKNENALVILAQMITLTPGTISLDFSPDRKVLWIHVLHTDNPAQSIADIKAVFERPLQKIFNEMGAR